MSELTAWRGQIFSSVAGGPNWDHFNFSISKHLFILVELDKITKNIDRSFKIRKIG